MIENLSSNPPSFRNWCWLNKASCWSPFYDLLWKRMNISVGLSLLYVLCLVASVLVLVLCFVCFACLCLFSFFDSLFIICSLVFCFVFEQLVLMQQYVWLDVLLLQLYVLLYAQTFCLLPYLWDRAFGQSIRKKKKVGIQFRINIYISNLNSCEIIEIRVLLNICTIKYIF